MIFFQPVFFGFFAIFFPLYGLLRNRLARQNALILLGSYIFYGWWDVRFLILITISTVVDYICGLVISGDRFGAAVWRAPLALLAAVLAGIAVFAPVSLILIASLTALGMALLAVVLALTKEMPHDRRRRLFLGLSILTNLGILATFKYFDFFAGEFAQMASAVGWEVNALTLNLILPVGISFYTFQTMSYTIDIYRKDFRPTREFLQFAAFVSFFPQLVAGPIERARNLLPQFAEPRQITADRLRSGALLFMWGFYKKVVIADNVAPVSDRIFSDPTAVSTGELLAGALAFTIQIYCDFSGYSDMARGLARMLGFELMVNFRMPYFSRTPSEFWQRWHISLSSWLRDYLYITLGGNRGGAFLTYRNLSLTMLLGGLWHGAAWTFIAWGAFHGAILVVYRIGDVDNRLSAMAGALRMLAMLTAGVVMFVLTVIGWVFFRAASFTDAAHMLAHMWMPVWSENYATVFFYAAPLVIIETFMRLTGRQNPWERMPGIVVFNLCLFVLFSVLFLDVSTGQDFIYFDF
ncbi:MBOAT family O-acyltransferase [uncultured Tateyamaria sp.]|uniref:MBOAT family O-acyltransferase n=1 Tax=uncultured Tateyamaria sp. TaxID=455651 RepID=UPI0026196277|nr:MBOAT family O-acyltransferase [uncultured Tateyamaria sp.]